MSNLPPPKATTKERVLALHKEGLNGHEIARKLGLVSSTVYFHLGVQNPSGGCLARASWSAWLETMTEWFQSPKNGAPARTINGHELGKSDKRLFTQWVNEGRIPTLSGADRFCCAIGAPLQHFFTWCHFNERNPWHGEPPEGECPIDDVPEKVLKVLSWHLRKRTPFKEAWRLAVSSVEMHPSWNTVVPGPRQHIRETRPINFARRVFKEVYEEVLGQDEERLAA